MNNFTGITEPLLIKMIAINYKITEDMPLNANDKEHMKIIRRCAELYNNLNEKIKIDTGRNKYKNNSDTPFGEMHDLFDMENGFGDVGVDDFSGYSDYSDLSDVSGETKIDTIKDPKSEEKKINELIIEEPITYETDPELIEICKENKIKFDELTKKLLIDLNTVQDSFWTTVDVM